MRSVIKLALVNIKTHLTRSAVICAAVILTSVLYMSVLSICFNIFNGYSLILSLAGGSDFHELYSIDGADDDDVYDCIKDFGGTDEVYRMTQLYTFSLDEREDADKPLFSAETPKILSHLFITLTDGAFPSSPDEIIVNSAVFENAVLGESVTLWENYLLSQDSIITYEHAEHTYTVSGIFKSGADNRAQIPAITLYDKAISAQLDGETTFYITYHNKYAISENSQKLEERLSAFAEDESAIHSQLNGAFLNTESMFNAANVALVIFSISVVFLCSFLLIYNIYSIALTQDIHTLGQLGVIGMTPRQLRSMTALQSAILFVLSMPVSLTAGYFIGWRLLSPVFMSLSGQNLDYRFSAWIPILTAALTLATLIYSALRPFGRLRRMTPIETLSSQSKAARGKHGGIHNVNPLRLSASFAFRDRRKTIITALSSALSIVLFVFIASVADAMAVITTAGMSICDIQLYCTETLERDYGNGYTRVTDRNIDINSPDCQIDAGLYSDILSLDGTGSVSTIRKTVTQVKLGDTDVSAAYEELQTYFHGDAAIYAASLEKALSGYVDAVFIGVPDKLCRDICVARENGTAGAPVYYDGEELYDGNHVLALPLNSLYDTDGSAVLPRYYRDGDEITSDTLEKTYTAIVPESDISFYEYLSRICGFVSSDNYVQLFVMPMSVYQAQFGSDTPIYALLCDSASKNGVDTEYRRSVNSLAEKYTSQHDVTSDGGVYKIASRGRFDELVELSGRISAIQVTGYGLSAIIFIIGAINMVNGALSSVTLRRREYAVLEAVGMTRGQLRLMLLGEGALGGAAAAIFALAAGVPLVKLFLTNALGVDVPVSFGMAAVMLGVLIAISAAVSLVAYAEVVTPPLIERIGNAE